MSEDVPQLRIIDQALWNQVQQRLAGIREASGANDPNRPKYWATRRAKHLLTGKLFCASCGGHLSALGRDYMACGGARRRSTCGNTASIRRSKLETAVVEALQADLMAPDDVHDFVREFTAEWNRLAAERNAGRAQDEGRLTAVERKIDKLIEAVMDGFRTEEMKQQLESLSQQKAQLQARLVAPVAKTPSLHPNLAELYRNRVATLQGELAKSNGNNSAVLEALRDLIERVDFGPSTEGGEPEIILTGALSAMVTLGLGDKPASSTLSAVKSGGEPGLFDRSVKVVAGVGFEPTTFRL